LLIDSYNILLETEKCGVLRIHFAEPAMKNYMDGVFQETDNIKNLNANSGVVI
jgi:hypothetical protein